MANRAPYDVVITHSTDTGTLVDLRATDQGRVALSRALGIALPATGDAATCRLGTLYALAPDEWLAITERGRPDAIESTLALESTCATDVSATYARFEIVGADTLAVLAQVSTLDLQRMARTACARTVINRVTAIVARSNEGVVLLVERSYARSMVHCLAAASGRPVTSAPLET
ncbi:MAG: sarcosine oxidase subunit gamma family protein [Burkholderiales bacterium]